MKLIIIAALILFGATSMTVRAQPAAQPFHAWAPTPPMGWNSWDCFGTAVTEELTKQNADYMAERLASHGWKLITVDIQWYEPNARNHDYVEGAKLEIDTNGRLLPATNKFPSAAGGKGFKALADYIHGKGLTFGIHLMRGIPRQAVRENTPVLGADGVRAADIANTNDKCSWNPDMFGVDMTKPGAQAYYDSVFDLIASWDVDFVKVDDLSRPYDDHKPEIEAIRKAIDKAAAKYGRPIVLSTSPGETPLSAAEHVGQHANLWRISDDFWDQWPLLKSQFKRCADWAKHGGVGFYPDADMLALGAIRQGKGQPDPWTRFTPDEQITHMTLWSIARSPLIFGGHLPKNDAWTLSLLTDDEVLAVNQHGLHPREVSNDNGLIVWSSDVPDSKDKYVAVFNTRDLILAADADGIAVTVPLEKIGMSGKVRVRDLWKSKDLGEVEAFAPIIRFHGAAIYRLRTE
jgi:alpha-galactosidase